ncbi:MAG TPA: J domain-containing protein [Thermoleophilia bacterium]|nr:J domain-containing protein [Thermoleophilia bacterium]
MLLAELEIRHSRAVAPTRRVALGELWLPADPAPGFGGLLLAGIVAAMSPGLDEDLRDDLDILIDDLERGRRIAQPRLRHRFQTDVVGLERSRHQLTGEGEALDLQLDDHASPLPQVLGAVYAAGKLSYRARPAVFRLLRRATRWRGDNDAHLVSYLTGDEAATRPWRDAVLDEGWALDILGFKMGSEPSRSDILRRFRKLIRDAHPDHGAAMEGAGVRVTELSAAKRILLAD